MGWQIPICQKGRRPLKKSMPDGICRIGIRLRVGKFRFAKKDEVLYSPLKKYALRHLPNRSSATHRMPYGICRIGVRQPIGRRT